MLLRCFRTMWLIGVGVAWFYEAFSIKTRRTPTITQVVHAYQDRRFVPHATVAGCLAIAAVAIGHLVIVREMVDAEVASRS